MQNTLSNTAPSIINSIFFHLFVFCLLQLLTCMPGKKQQTLSNCTGLQMLIDFRNKKQEAALDPSAEMFDKEESRKKRKKIDFQDGYVDIKCGHEGCDILHVRHAKMPKEDIQIPLVEEQLLILFTVIQNASQDDESTGQPRQYNKSGRFTAQAKASSSKSKKQ